MLNQINGLHHVTSLASDARANNAFFTNVLGLRRVKKTVNFDAPDVYHLYYGDEVGSPGTVMTYFPFPRAARAPRGVGEVGRTAFSIPPGTSQAWLDRLETFDVAGVSTDQRFGEMRVLFDGPDGDQFALVESEDDRTPWTGNGVSADIAIRGFHSTDMRLRDAGASAELLQFMGYEKSDQKTTSPASLCLAATRPRRSTSKCCLMQALPVRVRDRSIISPSRSKTAPGNWKSAKPCSTPVIRSPR